MLLHKIDGSIYGYIVFDFSQFYLGKSQVGKICVWFNPNLSLEPMNTEDIASFNKGRIRWSRLNKLKSSCTQNHKMHLKHNSAFNKNPTYKSTKLWYNLFSLPLILEPKNKSYKEINLKNAESFRWHTQATGFIKT